MSNSGISLVLVVLLAVGCFCVFYPQVENFFIFYPQASFDAVGFFLSKEMSLCSFSVTGMPGIFLTDLRM
jgi:hypothetical protein